MTLVTVNCFVSLLQRAEGANSFLLDPFRRGLVHKKANRKKANRKSKKLYPFCRMAKNVLSVSIPHNKLLLQGSCKKFCHWVQITSVLRFIKHIFITNLQSIPPLLKHIFVTFLPSREKQINSLLLVSVGDTDK